MYGSAAQVSAPVSVSVTVSAETDTAHSALVSVTAETEKSGLVGLYSTALSYK